MILLYSLFVHGRTLSPLFDGLFLRHIQAKVLHLLFLDLPLSLSLDSSCDVSFSDSAELELSSSQSSESSESDSCTGFRNFRCFVFNFFERDSTEVGCLASILIRPVAAVCALTMASSLSRRWLTRVRTSSTLTGIGGSNPDVIPGHPIKWLRYSRVVRTVAVICTLWL